MKSYEVLDRLAGALGLSRALKITRLVVDCPVRGPVTVLVTTLPGSVFADVLTDTLRIVKVPADVTVTT